MRPPRCSAIAELNRGVRRLTRPLPAFELSGNNQPKINDEQQDDDVVYKAGNEHVFNELFDSPQEKGRARHKADEPLANGSWNGKLCESAGKANRNEGDRRFKLPRNDHRVTNALKAQKETHDGGDESANESRGAGRG